MPKRNETKIQNLLRFQKRGLSKVDIRTNYIPLYTLSSKLWLEKKKSFFFLWYIFVPRTTCTLKRIEMELNRSSSCTGVWIASVIKVHIHVHSQVCFFFPNKLLMNVNYSVSVPVLTRDISGWNSGIGWSFFFFFWARAIRGKYVQASLGAEWDASQTKCLNGIF